MSRRPNIADLYKRLGRRIPVWIIGLIGILLVDEYIKEGYFFNPVDILYPGTHEFIIVVIAIAGIIFLLKRRKP